MPSRLCSSAGHLVGDGDVPAAHEDRGDRGDVGVEPGLDPPLDPAHVGLGGAEVLLVVEEQGDVDRDPGEDRLLDRLAARLGAGDLDEEVLALGLGVERRRLLDRLAAVVGEQRRDLERAEAVDAGGALVHAGEEVGGVPQVGDGELEEDPLVGVGADALAGLGGGADLGDLLVVGVAAGDRLVEDRRVRGQAGDRELVDVALQGPVAEHRAGDVVEPEALPQLVQSCGCLHERPPQVEDLTVALLATSRATSATCSGVNPNSASTSANGADWPKVVIPMIAPSVPT